MPKSVTLLDYGAGNVRSVRNAIHKLGFDIIDVVKPSDIDDAQVLIFPGVGSFGSAIDSLEKKQLLQPLRRYVLSGRPFLGICLGMQLLFDSSTEGAEQVEEANAQTAEQQHVDKKQKLPDEESPSKSASVKEKGVIKGLGVIPGTVEKFSHLAPSIPHIGWNSLVPRNSTADNSALFSGSSKDKFYFVHSYRALPTADNSSFVASLTDYGDRFISAVRKGKMLACQFHPEKSGELGLSLLKTFLTSKEFAPGDHISNGHHQGDAQAAGNESKQSNASDKISDSKEAADGKDDETTTQLSKRIIACLDVRTNDQGRLVVTKGDQYDVREKPTEDGTKGEVRNLGGPVELAQRYYEEGADEITFLNITSFRNYPLADTPMLRVLEAASSTVFVPLCVGGGIREYQEEDTEGKKGKYWSALEVASQYFRSGADKVSIGSDAVLAAEEYYRNDRKKTGKTAIEMISKVYGAQAVVVSIDPKRVVLLSQPGPKGEQYCWYQCTIKGGREGRDIDAIQVAKAVEDLGAGEIMLNCIDQDGTKKGYDIDLLNAVCTSVRIPVIASSGAGKVDHFSAVFQQTRVEAALAAGIFHRREVPIQEVKQHLTESNIPVRL